MKLQDVKGNEIILKNHKGKRKSPQILLVIQRDNFSAIILESVSHRVIYSKN